MSDDKTKRGSADRSRISLEDHHELRYWTQKFAVSEETLAAAVGKVGHSVEKVAEYFSKTSNGPSEGGLSGLMKSALATVTGGPDDDAITLLKRDHREVEALFERYEDLEKGSRSERNKVVEEICALLTVHAVMEEEIFYPAVRRGVKGAADLLDEAQVEHGTVKDLVARLQRMKPGEDLYDANVTVLKEYVKHHVKEEENELFDMVKGSDLDLDRLGRKLEERKLELMTAIASRSA